MKRSMELINKYKTPDDWKQRAKKIAHGKGIYANVKTFAWWKAAVAAAVALLLGIEGYSILHGSNDDMIDNLQPAPTDTVGDEATRRYIIGQKLKSYYPNAFDKGLDSLIDKYTDTGFKGFFTTDNGVADSCSQYIEESGELDYPFDLSPECDGYIIDGDCLTALIRFTYTDTVSDEIYKFLQESLTPYACVYDTVSQELIIPESTHIIINKGLMSCYARVDVKLGDKLPQSGFSYLETDIHLYHTYSLGDTSPADISTSNDTRYGDYHFDVKVIPGADEIALGGVDAYDTLSDSSRLPYANSQSDVCEMTALFNTEHITRELTALADNAKRISPETALPYYAENPSYAQNISLSCEGFVTDGVMLDVFLTAYTPSSDTYLDDFIKNTSAKLYLYPEGLEIASFDSLEAFTSTSSDINMRKINLSFDPKYLLDGRKVEVHFISNSSEYNDNSLHYVFTLDLPESITAARRSEAMRAERDDISRDNIHADTMGVLITGTDRLFEQKLSEAETNPETGLAVIGYVKAFYTPAYIKMPDGKAYTSYIYYDPDTWELCEENEADDNSKELKWLPLVAGGAGANTINILSPDGTSAGWYINYKAPLGELKAIAFSDEFWAVQKQLLKDGIISNNDLMKW